MIVATIVSSLLLIASTAAANAPTMMGAINNNPIAVVDETTNQDTFRALQSATLAEKWNITNPTFDFDSLSFDLDYGISDWILQGMVTHGIYDENCKEGGYTIPKTILSSSQNQLPNIRGNGLGKRVQQVTIAVNHL